VDDRLPRHEQPWWFDYSDSLDAFIALLHGTSWRSRVAALPHALPVLRRLLARAPHAERPLPPLPSPSSSARA